MPELPEVETVRRTLEKELNNSEIASVIVRYEPIIAYPDVSSFCKELANEKIKAMKRRGKWLIFETDKFFLLSHLRMEGKYFLRDKEDEYEKHEHVIFNLKDGRSLRYNDTRKFGRMYLYKKEEAYQKLPLCELGLEPFDETLSADYLKAKYEKKNLPIKQVLLDQQIIVGIGNIYADEILFLSKINPLKKASSLNAKERTAIIQNTRSILKEAIEFGGTTIKSYESSKGVHGRFQQKLLVHNKLAEPCPNCQSKILKITVNGRSTYYCPNCQK